ncbi:general secretion pathway protein L [Oryzisolibacter propanilivorax]|uniref:General secretion pathway protein L n=1 Tax=Oryzisolibacter propanilivorax TaxID=1527607 RepID=A0A1G9VBD8_9BURK|nr:type II secretion system protein GspL [Oryzisolibacter propanilivorax]SDM69380.1 general secretion pathway protein L [Oryzisolibacter propanilivorax]
MSTLVITLSEPGSATPDRYDHVLSADGQAVTRHASSEAALLPGAGRTGETVALVPVRALSWQRVTLPPGSLAQPARLRAVLEGLLEEHLLDEPAALHFALAPGAQAGSPAWVAVCDRAWLRAALQTLEAAGHPADRVVPEFAPGATASGQTEATVLGPPEDARLVLAGMGDEQALAVLPLAAAPALGLPGPAAEGAPPVRAEPAVVALAERLLTRPVQLQTAPERALAAARGAWDLAQLDLASSGRRRALRRAAGGANTFLRAPQWRAARWGLGLALAVHVIGLNLWALQDRQQLAAQQAQVRAVLTGTFPQVQVVVDAPLQMQRELARLRAGAGGLSPRDLEPLLAAAATALPPGRLPSAIEYGDGELRLRGIALGAEELAALRQRLAGDQADARQQDDGTLVLLAAAGGTP